MECDARSDSVTESVGRLASCCDVSSRRIYVERLEVRTGKHIPRRVLVPGLVTNRKVQLFERANVTISFRIHIAIALRRRLNWATREVSTSIFFILVIRGVIGYRRHVKSLYM